MRRTTEHKTHKLKQSLIWIMILFLVFTCGCNSLTQQEGLSRFPELVDQMRITNDGTILEKKYKGKTMYFFEQLYSVDKSISVSSIYCGFGTAPYLVKVRVYGKLEKVEHTEFGYSYFKEEYVCFRQESININSPMILMLETKDNNGELSRKGYISQWESQEYFEKFIKENEVCIRWNPGKINIKNVDTYQSFQPIFPSSPDKRP